MYNIKVWYNNMSYVKEYSSCNEFCWQSDRMVILTIEKIKHFIPLYNVDDVEIIEF
jgi:hypothetical protein